MHQIKITLGFFLFICFAAFSQNTPKAKATYIEQSLTIDGVLDEPAWLKAEPLSAFHQNFPTDTLMAQYPTEIKILFNKTFLYIGIVAESSAKDFVVASLKRDFQGSATDNVSFFLTPFKTASMPINLGSTPMEHRENHWCPVAALTEIRLTPIGMLSGMPMGISRAINMSPK